MQKAVPGTAFFMDVPVKKRICRAGGAGLEYEEKLAIQLAASA
ncbi:MAG: hypothetical protein RR855_06850 [Comamonas sp.]